MSMLERLGWILAMIEKTVLQPAWLDAMIVNLQRVHS